MVQAFLLGLVFFLLNGLFLASMTRSLRKRIRARDELLSMVSHELANPLSVVLLGSGFLRKRMASALEPWDPVEVSQVQVVETAAIRMRELLGELHDSGKIRRVSVPKGAQHSV